MGPGKERSMNVQIRHLQPLKGLIVIIDSDEPLVFFLKSFKTL